MIGTDHPHPHHAQDDCRPATLITFHDLVPYAQAWALQQRLHTERVSGSRTDTLVLLEHMPVYTIGRRTNPVHLRRGEAALREAGVAIERVNRGGSVTYHGPGQIVGYPILDLKPDRCDVHRYVRDLEEVLIRTAGDYGIDASRVDGLTGVWVGRDKLAAIGVRIGRWITSHGFAFNVSTDLDYFNLIVPCGIADRGVTSLERLLGRPVDHPEVEARIANHFRRVFAKLNS